MEKEIKKIEDEKVFETIKLSVLRKYVQHKFTQDEIDMLSVYGNNDTKLRAYIVSLYKKYIDEVIAEQQEAFKKAAEEEAKKAAEEANKPKQEEKTSQEEEVPWDKLPENLAKKANEETKIVDEKKEEISVDWSVTLVIRGIQNCNGTVSITCEKLLVLAMRNLTAQFIFKSRARCHQFLNVLKNVKTIKGIPYFTEATRNAAVKNIERVNPDRL